MNNQETSVPPPRSAREMYQYYLRRKRRKDGITALSRLEGLNERMRETNLEFVNSGKTPSDFERLRFYIENFRKKIAEVHAAIGIVMRTEAAAGRWFAVGRRSAKHGFELVPPNQWAFLELARDENIARGKDVEYRDLKCWLTRALPEGHRYRLALERALALHEARLISIVKPPPQRVESNGKLGRRPYEAIPLIKEEHQRRLGTGSTCKTNTEEAVALLRWLEDRHPNLAPPSLSRIRSILPSRKQKPIENAHNCSEQIISS